MNQYYTQVCLFANIMFIYENNPYKVVFAPDTVFYKKKAKYF